MSENRLGASLILNESKTEQRLISRAKAWGSTDQIDSPHCNGIPLVQNQEGFWLAPAGCQEVAWNILLDQAIQGQSRMDEQQITKLLPAGWVLLSESTSLLKVKDSLGDDALTSTNSKSTLWGATALGQNRWRVPSWDMAPEFFIIGHVPMLTHKTGPLTIRYVMDDQQKVEQLGLLPLHKKALSFLLGILPSPAKPSAQDHELLVI